MVTVRPRPAHGSPRRNRHAAGRRTGVRWSLRSQLVLLLALCLLLVVMLAGLMGSWLLRTTQDRLGESLARNLTQYNEQRVLTPVLRELALAQRLAASELTRRWLTDERNPEKRALFLTEAEGYRDAFADHSYFVASATSGGYYFSDATHRIGSRPMYVLNAQKPDDQWYFRVLKDNQPFSIAVDRNAVTRITKLWFDVPVRQGGRTLGMVGTGIDLTAFLRSYASRPEEGVTPLVFTAQGDVLAYPDLSRLDYQSNGDSSPETRGVYQFLDREADRALLRRTLSALATRPDETSLLRVRFDGAPQVLSISALPQLGWYSATAVNLRAAQVLDRDLLRDAALLTAALLAALLLGISLIVHRTVLAPVLGLTASVRAVERGEAPPELKGGRQDEIGELAQAFSAMTRQVRAHTAELEERIQDRTHELVAVNAEVSAVNRHLRDSIDYASLIQAVILPGAAPEWPHFALWRPRDTVGGDFYLIRPSGDGCLFGVIDCAGHGVAGALMTMLAHSALRSALEETGPADPAQLLTHLDTQWRALLRDRPVPPQVATTLDAGFAYLDRRARTVTFAGAKINLLFCRGTEVRELEGGRRAVGSRRPPKFANTVVPTPEDTALYLTTDGLLDQAGGPHGYSFGHERLHRLVAKIGRQDPEAQRLEAERALDAYRGESPQRDDVTLLGFFT